MSGDTRITAGFNVWSIFCLFFFHCAKVVDEDKGTIVVGIELSSRSLVARTEVALYAS